MKKYLTLSLIAVFWSCSGDDNVDPLDVNLLEAQTLTDVSYGADPEQKIDIYLPLRKNDHSTKVMFFVHGGGWTSGSKEEMTASLEFAQQIFPNYAFVNIGYRLATPESPAYPKQIDDIKAVVAFIKKSDYSVSENYAFLGVSAGAHLSMLYAYGFDTAHHVKAICSIVGPTDFNDPAYTQNADSDIIIQYLTSDTSKKFLTKVSPITHVNWRSAPTIQFMGNADPLVPASQGPRLKAKLDRYGVANELNIYDAGHEDFSQTNTEEIYTKLGLFFTKYFK